MCNSRVFHSPLARLRKSTECDACEALTMSLPCLSNDAVMSGWFSGPATVTSLTFPLKLSARISKRR